MQQQPGTEKYKMRDREGARATERENEKEETGKRKKARRRNIPKRQRRQLLGEEEVLEPELKESQWSSRSHASRILRALF